MLKSFRISLFALFAFAVVPLCASGPYLGKDAPDGVLLLPPPPPPGSAEDIADREAAFQVYSTCTPEQFAAGVDQQRVTIFHLAPSVGAWFKPGKCPKTEAFFKQITDESFLVTRPLKLVWKRPRPYISDPVRFSKVIEPDPNPTPTYPSGHATRATLYALILAEIFPEHRDEILNKALESGWLRVQGGVHTPLDIYAGRTLGRAIAQAFLRNAEFQRDLAEVKAEIAAAQK
ncbi:MAG: phosphatase PAP2 family protein [Nibricoccus sp.]